MTEIFYNECKYLITEEKKWKCMKNTCPESGNLVENNDIRLIYIISWWVQINQSIKKLLFMRLTWELWIYF